MPVHFKPVDRDFRCEVLLVGAGITGSMLAAWLTAEGHDVVVVDREPPGRGSTAASTAMLLWELDTSLAELTARLGFDKAARILQLSYQATWHLADWIEAMRIPCQFARRRSLLLAAEDQEPDSLRDEHSLRLRAALPSRFVANQQLWADYGMHRAAALVSTGAAETDPALLAHAMLRQAMAGGARVHNGEAVHFESLPHGAGVVLAGGVAVEARHVVLATGYDMPPIIRSDLHSVTATWVVATQRLARVWPHRALVWEAAENYTYARTTLDRIVIGGLDDATAVEPEERDALMTVKGDQLLDRLASIWPEGESGKAYEWSGAFGKTTDGLPLIGHVPGQPNLYGAYGYGGNGITFSYLAAAIISRLIKGEHHYTFDYFAIDRNA